MRLIQRLPRIERPDRTLEVLNAVVFVATLLGGGLTAVIGPADALWVILAGLILFAIYIWVAYSRRRSVYDFKIGSKEYVEFFTRWYGRQGEHVLFCDDLYWMDTDNTESIRNALKKRPKTVMIALRRHDGIAYEELKRAGVKMLEVDEALATRATFSVNRDGEVLRMIVRNKDTPPDGDRIQFQLTIDEFVIRMAQDLVNNNCTAAA